MKPFPKLDIIPYALDDYNHPGRIPIWITRKDGSGNIYQAEMEECDRREIDKIYENLMAGIKYRNIRHALKEAEREIYED